MNDDHFIDLVALVAVAAFAILGAFKLGEIVFR